MKVNLNLTESKHSKFSVQGTSNEDWEVIHIERGLFDMLTYFDKLYNHLSSRTFYGGRDEESYDDFMERFYSSSYLPNDISDNNVSFVYDGNIVFSRQMALAGKTFFTELYEIYKNDLEITPEIVNESWNYTKEFCKPEIESNDLHYISKNYTNFLNLAEKIIPTLEQMQEASSRNPFDFSSLPRYPVYSSIQTSMTNNNLQEPVKVNDETKAKQHSDSTDDYDFYYTDDEKQPNKWVRRTMINVLTNPISIAIKTVGGLIALLFN